MLAIPDVPDAVPSRVLDELRARLDAARVVELLEVGDWSLGVKRGYLDGLLFEWREAYDWRVIEAWIRGLPWVVAGRSRVPVRLVHQRGSRSDAPVVVLLHGWPDSVMRFKKVLPLLKNVHVLIPAFPGFPFAAPSPRSVASAADIAGVLAAAVHELGYGHYVLSGGDVGTDVAEAWAASHPERVTALHLTDVSHRHALIDPPDALLLGAEERSYIDALHSWHAREGAYNHQQSTRPNTLAIGLGDSPVGLAAWIVEKLYSWSDCHGNLSSVFEHRDVLDWVTAYWVTGSIATSFAPYAHRAAPGHIYVPTAFTIFPGDIVNAPRSWASRFFDVRAWKTASAGGHFDAWERPADYADGIRAAIANRRT